MESTGSISLNKSNNLLDINNDNPKKVYGFIFLLSFILGVAIFLPHIISDGGYFYFIGDYNCQQIPFNMLAHDSIRSGDIFWSWNTDLGANFIGSYAFYLLGSPFFWLMLALPSSLVPMAIPWTLCLKFAVASITAYGYLSRFVKNKNYALFAALMYSFSGFSVYNIFFNHFNDVIALFPLMLIGLEEFMENDRKGVFAVSVFINALCNYYFFVAEVVFIVIYWCFRLYHDCWPSFNLKKFGWLAFESIIGFGLSFFIVLPAVLTTILVPRSDDKLTGWGLITYFEVHRYPQLLAAFFCPPELPSQPNLYPDSGGKWSSVAAWLPLFSMTGVLTWVKRPKKDWIGRLVVTLCFMAFIPPLNAMFQLLSNNFYTRWFFMLVLMLAVATEKSLEESTEKEFRYGFICTAAISYALMLPVGLVTNPNYNASDDNSYKIGLVPHPERLWAFVIIVTICLICVYILMFKIKRSSKNFNGIALIMLCVIIIGYGNGYLISGRMFGIGDTKAYTERNVLGREKIHLPDTKDYRIDNRGGEINVGIFWGFPNIQTFHSVVPGSIMEFYESIGVQRDVSSKPELSHMSIRPLLSVKYLFDDEKADDLGYSNWTKIAEQNGYYVWENENFIPFGFTYDYYISRTDYESYDKSSREHILLEAVVLEDDDVERYAGPLIKFEKDQYIDTSETAIELNSNDRRNGAATDFKRDNYGFEADINLDEENLVFFSVPHEPGWSVTVNGEKAEVIKANVGFMAVKCPAGQNHIRFNFMTPGLIPGIVICIVCLALLIIYILYFRKRDKNVTVNVSEPDINLITDYTLSVEDTTEQNIQSDSLDTSDTDNQPEE